MLKTESKPSQNCISKIIDHLWTMLPSPVWTDAWTRPIPACHTCDYMRSHMWTIVHHAKCARNTWMHGLAMHHKSYAPVGYTCLWASPSCKLCMLACYSLHMHLGLNSPSLVCSWACAGSFLGFSSIWVLYFGPNWGTFSITINPSPPLYKGAKGNLK